MKKIFLDANILIDLIDSNRTKHNEVLEFIKKNSNSYFYTSCDILTTIYYVTKKVKEPLLEIEKLLDLVYVISFSNAETKEAIDLMNVDKRFKDLEDTLQYILAKQIKADCIVTNDKGFCSPDIEIINI